MMRRWHRNMDVSDDTQYVDVLTNLSRASVRRSFNAYIDIDWESTEFNIDDNDSRWILPETDPVGRHPWYQAQPRDRQIEMGMWYQANVAKSGLQLESILIRGLMSYAFRVPNGSPEHRYCMHEVIEEGQHNLMFQELVNRIGIDVPGLPRYLRWLSPLLPLSAGPIPNVFFFGVLAGEDPYDHVQRAILRESDVLHPVVGRVVAIHVAEEARHISFSHEHLRSRVPQLWWWQRFLLSLYVPLIMRMLGVATVVPPRAFWREFGIPRKVKKELFFGAPQSQKILRDMFADIRMLCYDTGLMNGAAKLIWRICRIYGTPSRYHNEPQRQQLAVAA